LGAQNELESMENPEKEKEINKLRQALTELKAE
jgi:hypothetical protein